MTTSTPNKTLGTSLLGIQNIAASSIVVGSEVDVTGKFAGTVYIHFGRVTTSAPTTGVSYRIEGCSVPTGTLAANVASQWYPLAILTTGVTAALNKTISATSGAALTVNNVTSLTAQLVCLASSNSAAPTLSNTEWFRILSAASTTVTAEESFKNAYTSGGFYTQAEMFAVPLDLSAIGRLRIVADGSLHNQAFITEAYLSTLDSITNT